MAGFDPITAGLGLVNSVIDRVLPDKAANDAAKAQLVQMQLKGELDQITGQLDINKVEAASNSKFVAGWRPFIGWVSGVALAEDMVLRPLLAQISALFGHPIVLPPLDLATLLPLVGGMLGFGTMRSVEKLQGTSNGH